MRTTYFYPRPPRGGRLHGILLTGSCREFLSTPSARRATFSDAGYRLPPIFLSTPSARRATTEGGYVGSDLYKFLSTPSARRATVQPPFVDFVVKISIHALREEGDPRSPYKKGFACPFLSTPSARRATSSQSTWTTSRAFLSTPSARRATFCVDLINSSMEFLSTPSARRATYWCEGWSAGRCNFYPRPPRGGRRLHHPGGSR